jgi:cytosine/adenosine deaminase-related metal-dependent hydrolase
MGKEKFATLWAYIENQEELIQNLLDKIELLEPINEDRIVNLAYQMHNLYSAFEDMFKEISRTFENDIDRDSGFHKHLLVRMKIAIPGIRPHVLSPDSYSVIGELMAFRHVFRHAYHYNLSARKLEALKKNILGYKSMMLNDITAFKHFLKENFLST